MQTTIVAKTLVVDTEDKILLIRRSDTDTRRPLQWDIPGGHTDGDEYANEAAARETEEEAGVTLNPRELRLVYALSVAVDADSNVVWLFFVSPPIKRPEVVLSFEHDQQRWFSLEDAIEAFDYDRHKTAFEYIRDHDLLHAHEIK